MKDAHKMAILVSNSLAEQIEENPSEVFLAFAGLFCSMGVRMGVPEELSLIHI